MNRILILCSVVLGALLSAAVPAHANNCWLEITITDPSQGLYCEYTSVDGAAKLRPLGEHCRFFDRHYVDLRARAVCTTPTTNVVTGVYTAAILSRDGSEVLQHLTQPVRLRARVGRTRKVRFYLPTFLATSSNGSVSTFPVHLRTLSAEGLSSDFELSLRTQTLVLPPPPPPPPPCLGCED